MVMKKKIPRFSQVIGVYSVFVGFCHSALQSNVCVWSVDTRVYTQRSLSVFTMLIGTAVLSSLYSGVVVDLYNLPSIFTTPPS